MGSEAQAHLTSGTVGGAISPYSVVKSIGIQHVALTGRPNPTQSPLTAATHWQVDTYWQRLAMELV